MVAVTSQPPTKLPSPVERPGADIVIYDGHCKFCLGQVQRLARWDRTGRLAFQSLHDPEVTQKYPDLTHDMLMEQMYVVNQAGERFGGAAAFRYLSRRLPVLWPIAPMMHIPFTLPLWQWCYRQVAKRRYKMGKVDCDGDACKVHFR